MFNIYYSLQQAIEYYKLPVKLYLTEGYLLRIYINGTEHIGDECSSKEAELESSLRELFLMYHADDIVILFGDRRMLNFNAKGCLV